jgi:hypothetical protein
MKGRECAISFVIIVIKITIHLFWISCQYIQSSRCCDIGKILKSEVEMKQPPPPLPKLP